MATVLTRRTRLLGLTLITVLCSITIFACGGSADDDAVQTNQSSFASTESAAMSGAAEAPAADAEREEVSQPLVAPSEQQVIRTADIYLSVEDVGASIVTVRGIAMSAGGFVFSSSSYNDGSNLQADMTIRVPSDRFDEVLNQLRSASWVTRVDREQSSSQDVSGEYIDNESQLRTLRETQARMLELLGRAESIDDILRLELELQDIRGQVERIQGRQNYLDNATSLSTISVSLRPVTAVASTGKSNFSVVNLLERAWNHARGAVEAIVVAATTTLIVAAFVAPFAAVALLVIRRYRNRSRQTQVV